MRLGNPYRENSSYSGRAERSYRDLRHKVPANRRVLSASYHPFWVSTWSDIDQPVLAWLHAEPSSYIPEAWRLKLGLRRCVEPSEEVEGLSTEQVDQSLLRLQGHGLIDGERLETVGYAYWSRLRVTGFGLHVLSEWPDLDQLASAAGLKLLLQELANAAPDPEDQGALRRLLGLAGEVGDGVVTSTFNAAAGQAGSELADG